MFGAGPAKDKGFKTGDRFTVELPNDSGVKFDVSRAKKVGEVFEVEHGRVLREEVTTVNSNGVVLSQHNPIKIKIVEITPDKVVYEVVDQPNFYYEDIQISAPVVATDASKVDQSKNRVNVKYISTFESKTDPTLNNKEESKDAYIPIRGTSLSSTGVKLEFKTTQWRDVDTNKNLKASKVDTKTYPADKIEGYTFVRTDTDQKTGNVIHFFKKTGDTGARDDVKESKLTKFLEEGTNKVLKPEQKGDKFVEAGTIAGYTFVKSDVKGDITTHFFKKVEEPKKPEVPKTTEAPKTEEPKKVEKPKTADVKTPDKKDAVKTGANASAAIAPLLGIAGGAGAIGAAVYVAKKRKK